MSTTAVASWEYTNDFFAISFRESEEHSGSYVFSSGVSLPRFNPIIWGRTGICSNAAFKALQQLRADVSYFTLQRGILTRKSERAAKPEGRGDGWYQENDLLIKNASPKEAREILAFSARDLVQTIVTAARPDITEPVAALDSAAMQRFLESIAVPNFREAAPSPILKPNGETADGRR